MLRAVDRGAGSDYWHFMLGYTARLKSDLARWRSDGLITATQEASLYEDARSRAFPVPITTIVALLGASLLGLAAITFVAANWDVMSKLSRLVVLVGALWAAYGATYALYRSGHPVFAEVALLVAGALFGANIMLIAQTYHISGYTPDAILLWTAGVGLAAALLRSTPSLVFAIALMSCWIVTDAFDRSSVAFWHFGLAWFIGVGLAIRQDSLAAMHLLFLSLMTWMLTVGIEDDTFWPFSLVGLAVLAIGLATWNGATGPAWRRFLPALAVYGALIASWSLLLHQFGLSDRDVPRVDASTFWWAGAVMLAGALAWVGLRGRLAVRTIVEIAVLGAAATATIAAWALGAIAPLTHHILLGTLVLLGMLWLIVRGTRDGHRGFTVVGFVGFGAELFYIYGKTFGSLLSTSIYFLVAGLLLVGLSLAFVWLERRRSPHAHA